MQPVFLRLFFSLFFSFIYKNVIHCLIVIVWLGVCGIKLFYLDVKTRWAELLGRVNSVGGAAASK